MAVMRRLALLALILLLATPAGAQQQRLGDQPAPTAAQAGLRDRQEAKAPAEPEPLDFSVPDGVSALPAGLAFTRPLASTAAAGPGTANGSQCRTACAQSYYFCLAAEDEQTCNPQWARCVAGCS